MVDTCSIRPIRSHLAITRHGQIIGMIGLDDELGYWLAPEYHGKGYATEAARAVLENYFDNPYAAPLKSGYHLGNDRSANVLRKLGFARPCASHARMRQMSICRPCF